MREIIIILFLILSIGCNQNKIIKEWEFSDTNDNYYYNEILDLNNNIIIYENEFDKNNPFYETIKFMFNSLKEIDKAIINNNLIEDIQYNKVETFKFDENEFDIYLVGGRLKNDSILNHNFSLLQSYFVYSNNLGCIFRSSAVVSFDKDYLALFNFKTNNYKIDSEQEKYNLENDLFRIIKDKIEKQYVWKLIIWI